VAGDADHVVGLDRHRRAGLVREHADEIVGVDGLHVGELDVDEIVVGERDAAEQQIHVEQERVVHGESRARRKRR
jgi:hypothetical protein